MKPSNLEESSLPDEGISIDELSEKFPKAVGAVFLVSSAKAC